MIKVFKTQGNTYFHSENCVTKVETTGGFQCSTRPRKMKKPFNYYPLLNALALLEVIPPFLTI